MRLKARSMSGVQENFFPRFAEKGCKNVCELRPHALVMVDSTKEAAHMCKVFRLLHL